MSWQTKTVLPDPGILAPDGSAVRVLCATARGSMAHFTLSAGAVARPVAHRTIDEIWYFISGTGQMWRRNDAVEEIVDVGPGVSISIPAGTSFQFRSDAAGPLTAVGVAMPPWPGPNEARSVAGCWPPSV
jgi:mannose-6-phosphate isomerase-like protein (cupin superfamily)